jgi:hypothetical protein
MISEIEVLDETDVSLVDDVLVTNGVDETAAARDNELTTLGVDAETAVDDDALATDNACALILVVARADDEDEDDASHNPNPVWQLRGAQ